jgi:DNA-binding response OmpR family regulator
MLAYILSSEAFQIIPASSGSVLFQLFLTQPDLVVLDIPRPAPDERQILRRIRDHSPVPIIVLTAQSDIGIHIRLLTDGADDCMVKPLNARELQARIQALLRRFQFATQPTQRGAPIPARGVGTP